MDKDRIKGAGKQAKGAIKDAAGRSWATGKCRLKQDGQGRR
jgi:uncharacterized protein YjbJ (UPF0337 family)